MASGKCVYLQQKLGDFILGRVNYTPPGTLWIALSTTAFDPTTTGDILLSNEPPSNTGYARVSFTNDLNFWSATDTSGNKSNSTSVGFPTATNTWGTLRSFYLLDGNARSSADNCLYGGDLTAATNVAAGPGPAFGQHDLTVHQG